MKRFKLNANGNIQRDVRNVPLADVTELYVSKLPGDIWRISINGEDAREVTRLTIGWDAGILQMEQLVSEDVMLEPGRVISLPPTLLRSKVPTVERSTFATQAYVRPRPEH